MSKKRIMAMLLVIAMLFGLIPNSSSLSLTAKASEGDLIQINSGQSLGIMNRGDTVFADRDWTFLDYPAAFDGMSYVKSNIGDAVNITTLESTWIYVVTPLRLKSDSQAMNLVNNLGFKLVDIAPWSLYATTNTAAFQSVSVYERHVSKNETIEIPKWGIVIPSNTQLDLATNLVNVPDSQMAVMESTSGKPVYNMACSQDPIFNDRTFVFGQIPYFMAGKNYIATNLTKGEDSIVATRAGYLYCMTPTTGDGTQVSNLQNQGFETVYTTTAFMMHSTDGNATKTILRKYVNVGDTVTINRYVIPFFSGENEVSSEMAVLEPCDTNTSIVQFLPGINVAPNTNNYAFKDSISTELVGKSLLYANSNTGGTAVVTKAGTLYAFVGIGSGATPTEARARLTDAGFKRSTCRPISIMDFDADLFQLYEKEVSVGETIELGSWVFVLFDEVSEEQYYSVPSDTYTPTIIWNPGSEYAPDTRNWQGIASIEKTGDRIWAAWYTGGTTEPHPDNYSLLAYSDDDGETWVDPAVVITNEHPEVVAADPQFWIDPDGTLWIIFLQRGGSNDSTCCAWYMTCDNPEAETPEFSEPNLMTTEGIVRNRPTILSNGEWLVTVMSYTDNGGNNAPILSSTDNGKTWKVKGVVNFNQSPFDEAMIIERQDGVLWYLSRTTAGELKESFSYDGGETWTTGVLSGIANPGSRFYIRRLASGNLLLINHYNFSGRSHMTALLSTDDGETWPYTLLLDERSGVSYPDAVQTSDGTIYAIHDYDRFGDMEIVMHVFNEEDIIAGEFQSDVARSNIVISSLEKAPDLTSEGLYTNDLSQNLTWASTTYSTGGSAASAFDGDANTRWCANDASFPQTLMVDLGEVKDISQINISYEQESEWEYQLLISNDGFEWETYGKNDEEISKQQDYSIEKDAQARYVTAVIKNAGLDANGGQCWASIWEMEVLEKETGTNLALNQPSGATSSSVLASSSAAAFDDDYSTRYCAVNSSMPQQVMVDLGNQYDIGAVYINFEQVSKWKGVIETSKDGIEWETFSESLADNSYQTLQKGKATGRYVRLTVNSTTGGAWASVYEMKVYTTEPVVSPFEQIKERVTQDENGVKIEFRGGSLRMDYTDSDKTSLRFGYKIYLPEGATLNSWSWQYTTTNPNNPVTGIGKNKTVEEDGSINANLVITGIPSNYYDLVLTAKMKIEYTLADGTVCTLEETVVRERSVNIVAENILASKEATQTEKDYATNILQ